MIGKKFILAGLIVARAGSAGNKQPMEEAFKGCVVDMMTINAPQDADITGYLDDKGFSFSATGKVTEEDAGYRFKITFAKGEKHKSASVSLSYSDNNISRSEVLSIEGKPGSLSSTHLNIPTSYARIDEQPRDIRVREGRAEDLLQSWARKIDRCQTPRSLGMP